jgi:hypothetical protein
MQELTLINNIQWTKWMRFDAFHLWSHKLVYYVVLQSHAYSQWEMFHDFFGQTYLVKSSLSSLPNPVFTRSIIQKSSPPLLPYYWRPSNQHWYHHSSRIRNKGEWEDCGLSQCNHMWITIFDRETPSQCKVQGIKRIMKEKWFFHDILHWQVINKTILNKNYIVTSPAKFMNFMWQRSLQHSSYHVLKYVGAEHSSVPS